MRAGIVALTAVLVAAETGIAAGKPPEAVIRATRLPADGRFDPYPRWTAPARPSLAIALSGGGARGLAHIGVIAAMKEDGIEFDAVAGTSAGALVGGFLAAGFEPAEIESIVRDRRWNSIVAGLDLRTRVLSEREDLLRSSAFLTWRTGRGAPIRFGSLVETTQLDSELYRYFLGAQRLCDGDFDRLRYRFRPVATDVRTGKKVAPASGDMAALIRGSIAVPGVFSPHPYGDMLLSDGLLVENLPVETASTFEADLLIAVDVTEEVDPAVDVRGTFDALNRSLNILMLEQVDRARVAADVQIRPTVVGVSPGDFEANLDRLVEAGRSAYRDSRSEIWSRLEGKAGAGSRLNWDSIEGPPEFPGVEEELTSRLGRTGSAGVFRLESELARLLNRGPWADGHFEIVERDGSRVLRVVLERHPELRVLARTGGAAFGPKDPVPRPPLGEPFSWAAVREAAWPVRTELLSRGRNTVRLERVEWTPETGTLTATVSEPAFAGIVIANENDEPRPRLSRLFAGLVGKPFRYDPVAQRLEEIDARGLIEGWRIEPIPAGPDEIALRATVREDRHFEIAGSVAYRDALDWAGLLRLGYTNLTGRGDTVEAFFVAAGDAVSAEARYRSEFLGGFRNLGFEASMGGSDIELPRVGVEQEIVDEEFESFEATRLDAGLFRRITSGAVLRAGLSRRREVLDEGAFGPAETRSRTEVYASVDLDRRDRLLFPSHGFAIRWDGRFSAGGDPYRRNLLRFDLSHSVGRLWPLTLSLRLAGGIADEADRPAYWFDPGGFRDVYGFLPYGLQSPRFRHGGGTLRFRFLDLGPVRSFVEIGADVVRIGFGDEILGVKGDTVVGYGASVTALVRAVGPITLGWARNDQGASLTFLTLGYPFVKAR